MFSTTLVVLLASHVASETQKMSSEMYITSRQGINSMPYNGYVYTQVNNQPGYLATFNSGRKRRYDSQLLTTSRLSQPQEKYGDELAYEDLKRPLKIKRDAEYERLKSLMYYNEPEENLASYSVNNIQSDSQDVRTTPGSSYEMWPYLLANYGNMYYYSDLDGDHDTEVDNAKIKRYAMHEIPVYEHIDDDAPTDIVIKGELPDFPSPHNHKYDPPHIHNHNYDHDEDSFNFNIDAYGFDEGKDKYDSDSHIFDNHGPYSNGDRTKDTGFDKRLLFDNSEIGNKGNNHNKIDYEQADKDYSGRKHYVDRFANKFGGEKHSKDANYRLKTLQDKNEKKKGFHRVYHKDEYKMDKEFYDNNAHLLEEDVKGNSALHNGGSIAALESLAAADVKERKKAYDRAHSAENDAFNNNHKGHKLSSGLNKKYDHYSDHWPHDKKHRK
ncbi:hypothetical protein JYU34_005328 [Plutella xylostella]|uniref:Uncharacterized protein n=1 Tax=Plutella xylostella TaxID=51655 RepID=A0ABQ7QWG1_PLUXY|nr:hypothetical protein JYU34_005328 [Plutella xylostella]